jgi:hypothetical protein
MLHIRRNFYEKVVCLVVDIGAQNWELEPAFQNYVVSLRIDLRFGIRDTVT